MKDLKDLNLLDRFLFAEAMEDPQNMRDVLEIILGKDVVLKHLPQTEKEARISPAYRFAKVDVWAKDTDEVVYDTEVQGTNTKNLPKRSRYYESIIDAKLLKPGERDFNKMNDIYIILIAPFDLFGKRKYMYTFEMTCKEDPSVSLEDGATRIFCSFTHIYNHQFSYDFFLIKLKDIPVFKLYIINQLICHSFSRVFLYVLNVSISI